LKDGTRPDEDFRNLKLQHQVNERVALVTTAIEEWRDRNVTTSIDFLPSWLNIVRFGGETWKRSRFRLRKA